MPTVFASASITLILFYLATLGMAYAHLLPPGFHMLWGFFTAILLVLLQCLVFGFFIGSGKSIKRVVQENGLSPDWIQRTKDYKNKSYPMLMLAIVLSVAAAAVGGGVSVQSVPLWVHQALVWLALGANVYSLWVSYRVAVENVEAIHLINNEIRRLKEQGAVRSTAPEPEETKAAAPPPAKPLTAAHFYFLAAAAWVPYLYVKFSLGSRTFPFWPFAALSVLFLLAGRLKALKTPKN